MLAVFVTILIFSVMLGIPAFASEDEKSAKIKQQNENLKQQADFIKKIEEASKSVGQRFDEWIQKQIDTIEPLNQVKDLNERLLGIENERLAAGEKALTQEERENANLEKRYKTLSDNASVMRKILADAEARGEAEGVGGDQMRARLKDAEELANTAARELGTYNKTIKATKTIQDGTASFITKFTGLASSFEDTLLGSMTEAVKDVGGLTSGLKKMGEQVAKQLSPANLLAATFEKVAESTKLMVLQADSAFSAFERATGAGDEFGDIILDARIDTAGMGASLSQVAAATAELRNGMVRFSGMTAQAQGQMASFTTTMEQLGISTGASVEFLNTATTSFGMSGDGAQAAMRDVATAAINLGMAPEQMMQGFNAAMPQLAKWGDQAIDVFKGIAAASKATGIEMQALLQITAQFDTFEGAAEAAGRLNAILGGDLFNSVEMMNASEEERIRLMIQGIELSGRSWESMGRFERQALASAAGITDMNQANQLFGQSLSAYDEQQRQASRSAMSQEQLEQRAKDATSAMEKFNAIMESMAIAVKPILTALDAVADAILWIQSITGNMFVPVIGSLIGIFYLMTKAVKMAAAAEQAYVIVKGVLTGATAAEAAVTGAATTKMNLFRGAMLRAVLPIALIVGGLYLAINGGETWVRVLGGIVAAISAIVLVMKIWNIVKGIQIAKTAAVAAAKGVEAVARGGVAAATAAEGTTSAVAAVGVASLSAAEAVAAPTTVAMGAAAGFSAPLMLAFGLAVLLVGIALALVIVSIAFVVKAFSELVGQMKDMDPGKLFVLAGGLIALGLAFLALGIIFAIPFTTLGLFAITLGLAGISAAMEDLSAGKITAFNEFIDNLSKIQDMEDVEVNLEAAADGLWDIAQVVRRFPMVKSIFLNATLDKMIEFTSVSGANMENASQLGDMIRDITSVKVNFTTLLLFDAIADLMKVMKMAEAASTGLSSIFGGGKTEKEVILKVNERQLGKVVVDLVKKKHNVRLAT